MATLHRWTFMAAASIALTLLMAACSGGGGGTDVLDQCVDHLQIKSHIHLTVIPVMNRQPADLPANLGITADCMRPLHTHDGSSRVHVESPDGGTYTLDDLFRVWGDDNPYGGVPLVAISLNATRFTGGYEDLVLEDGQRIVVEFRNN
jgi:hypothetical protein